MIKKILIAGGGSAGWMTASLMAKEFPDLDITLVESNKKLTIGVGESTLGHINSYFKVLGLKDKDWMSSCDATYKNSIQFTDFYKLGHRFQYPFGDFHNNNGVDYHDFCKLINYYDDLTTKDMVEFFNLNSLLVRYNKQINKNILGFDPEYHVAYHMDAEKLGIFLKNFFCKNVKHVIGHIQFVGKSETGIDHIIVDGQKFSADLYFDCTGFSSVLMNAYSNENFYKPFKYLINDRAFVSRRNYSDENDQRQNIKNVTDCKGMKYGWKWTIPLWNKISRGYVFSSRFDNEEKIAEEFSNDTGDDDFRKIEFVSGYRKFSWYKNIVSIGLSSGFIEPLESTGLFTTHENLLRVLKILKLNDLEVNSIDKTIYNKSVERHLTGLSEFVSMHYALSRRTDSKYWKYVREKYDYNEMNNYIDFFISSAQNLGSIFYKKFDVNFLEGMLFILPGMGFLPTTKTDILSDNTNYYMLQEQRQKVFKDLKNRRQLVTTFEDNFDYIKRHIYDED